MTRIHLGLASARFERPSKVDVVKICKESGEKATTNCSETYTEYFVKGTVPKDCEIHGGSPIVTDVDETTKSSSGTITGSDKEIDAEEPQKDNSSATTSVPEPTNTNTTNETNTNQKDNTTNTNNKTNTMNTTHTTKPITSPSASSSTKPSASPTTSTTPKTSPSTSPSTKPTQSSQPEEESTNSDE